MNTKLILNLVLAGVMAVSVTTALAAPPTKMKMTTDIPASITSPDKVKTSIVTLEFFDGVPKKNRQSRRCMTTSTVPAL